MAMSSPLSRKVYGAVLVLMVLISATKGENTASMTAESSTRVTAEVQAELPHVKSLEVQGMVIGDIKTVARRGTPGRSDSGILRASACMPSFVASAVVIIIVNVAAILS